MRSPFSDIDNEYRELGKRLYLDRAYNSFVCIDEVLKQLEILYDIDLSPLTTFNTGGLGFYKEHTEGWRDWKLSECSNEEERKQVLIDYQQELIKAAKHDKEEYENNWASVALTKKVILDLMNKILNDPGILKQINYTYFAVENFNMIKSTHKAREYYFIYDFEHIIDFCDFLSSKNIDKIAYYSY